MGVVALVGVVVPLIAASHYGALGIPRGDDWNFLQVAFEFADDGTLDPRGWAAMNLVGMVVLAAPVVWLFGESIVALELFSVVCGVVGLYATYRFARHYVDATAATFVLITVVSVPLWGPMLVTYQTDIPAWAFLMLSLWAGAAAVSRGSFPLLVAAGALGLAGFSIREFAIAGAVATCLGAYPQFRRRALVVLGALVVLAVAFFLWRSRLENWGTASDPGFPTAGSVRTGLHLAARSAVLVGLVVTPAVLFTGAQAIVAAARARVGDAITLVVGALVSVVLLYEVVANWSSGVIIGPGDLVLPNGAIGAGAVPGPRPDLFPDLLWGAFALVGVAGCALLALSVLAHWRPDALGLVLLAYAAFAFVPVIGMPFYDRYLFPLMPLAALFVLQERAQRSWVGVAALAGLATLAVVFTLNSASYDGTRWEVAERAASRVGAQQVDGGFEWNGWYHNRTPLLPGYRAAERDFCVQVRSTDRDPTVWGPFERQVAIVTRPLDCEP